MAMSDTSRTIEWSEERETGVRLVDVQHKYLIDIINELAEAIEAGTAEMAVKSILNLLKYYTEWHFEREELCMYRNNCPAGEANEKAHKGFLRTFEAFQEEFRQSGGSEDIARRMYAELTNWLVTHIQGVDSKLADCMH